MPQVFISYAWEDGRDAARWLYERFNREPGWSAWMDVELHAHSVFTAALQKQINTADAVVAVLTPGANRLEPPSFVQLELGYATQPEVKKLVYAVKALPTMVPLVIWGVTFIAFLDPADYEDAFRDLLGRMAAGAPRQALTLRQREEAYLRGLARDEINRRAARYYAELPAQAEARPDPRPSGILIDDDNETAAFLAEIAADIHTRARHSPDDDPNARRVENFAQLSDALAQYPRAALIGDPGSGKTTTLRRLAYTLAEAAAHDAAAPLPVYVPLGAYAGGDFAAFIDSHFGDLRLNEYLPHRPERLILLLDGLNETAHANVPTIEAWLKAHPAVSVRLTCRKLDYVERALDLQRVDVLPLDMPGIVRFIAAHRLTEAAQIDLILKLMGAEWQPLWEKFRAAGLSLADFFSGAPLEAGHPVYRSTTSDEDRRYNAMRAAGGYPGLLALARNPFLLTIAISLYVSTGDLPRDRAGLFAAFVAKLFAERGQPSARQQGLAWIEAEVLQTALARLAYAMQAEGRGTSVPFEWARAVVAAALPGQDAGHILYLAASSGILDRGGELRFAHQLLQEYFAAFEMGEAVRGGVPAERYFPSEAWWTPTGWEETALLLAEMQDDATKIVEWLTPVQPDLAYRIATASGVACAEAALHALHDPAPGARRSPYAVAAWGRLNHDRDRRPGVGLRPDGLPDIAWCDVPAGTFLYGKNKQPRTIAYPFRIARYPVTFIQFQAFLDSGQYDDPRWWAGMPEVHQRQPMAAQDNPYHNHPRDGVSWYQAVAFARWLDARYRQVGVIGAGVQLRLPLEEEWEYAARGVDGRAYPWGDGYRVGFANIHETLDSAGPYFLGRTTAVGLYPQGASPFGALDMAGNVWEWCLNNYESPDMIDLMSSETKVIRGGSFLIGRKDARAAARSDPPPVLRSNWFGGRCVVAAPVASLISDPSDL